MFWLLCCGDKKMNNTIFDIAIIGSGLCGICIADGIDTKKYKVCLIESGGYDESSNLHDYQKEGNPEGIQTISSYQFGGGHNVWHGLLAKMDASEIDENLWNINAKEFEKYNELAEKYLGLDSQLKKLSESVTREELSAFGLSEQDYKIFHQVKVKIDKNKKLNQLKNKNITVFLNTTVIKIKKENELYVVFEDSEKKIYSKEIILAANPIYNSAILLRSESLKIDESIQNIGKNLSDHPMGVIGKMEFRNMTKFPLSFIRKKLNKNYLKVGFLIKDEVAQLNHTFYLVPTLEKHFNKSNSSLRAKLISIRDTGLSLRLIFELLKNINILMFIMAYKFGIMPKTKYVDLLVVSEQNLDIANCVSIGDDGKVKKLWKFDDLLLESISRSSILLQNKFNKILPVKNINILKKEEMSKALTSAAHLCCTTSINSSEMNGVVDGNFKILGSEMIYIMGASVFPVATSLNTTLTAIALSIKLIEHINNKK